MTADLRVQIVNYRTRAFLLECLTSLFWSLDADPEGPLDCEVVILDNHSGDDLSDLATRFAGRRLDVHESDTNVGFGSGHNLLAGRGDAAYLFLLNPDTRLLQPGTLRRLVATARQTGAVVVGPKLLNADGQPQPWDHGELTGLLARAALATGNSYWRARSDACDVAWVSGAAFLIEKKWFDGLRGFDERFFLYKEEEELCWRLRAAGGRVRYEPAIAIFHHEGVVASKAAHMRASTDYFLWKHFRHTASYQLFRLANRVLR